MTILMPCADSPDAAYPAMAFRLAIEGQWCGVAVRGR